jgi:hypothetical protein
MKSKRIVLIVLVALVVLSTVGIAAAQAPGHRPGTGPRGEGGRGPRGHHPVLNGIRHAMHIIAEASGLERAEIVAQLAEGKTLAEIITESGANVDDAKADMLAPLVERAAAAVENGRITQDRADQLIAAASARLDELLNHVFERLADRDELPLRRRTPQGANEI